MKVSRKIWARMMPMELPGSDVTITAIRTRGPAHDRDTKEIFAIIHSFRKVLFSFSFSA